MNTFNIVTTQDKELFEVIFAAFTDHHEQPHEFVVESPVVAVKAVFYTWMKAQKAIDAFEPDDMNLDLKAVGEWIAAGVVWRCAGQRSGDESVVGGIESARLIALVGAVPGRELFVPYR